jgi:hypothetical protein
MMRSLRRWPIDRIDNDFAFRNDGVPTDVNRSAQSGPSEQLWPPRGPAHTRQRFAGLTDTLPSSVESRGN